MTSRKAMRLVANSRGRLCVRFIEGPDGLPITKLPAKLHRIVCELPHCRRCVYCSPECLKRSRPNTPEPNRRSRQRDDGGSDIARARFNSRRLSERRLNNRTARGPGTPTPKRRVHVMARWHAHARGALVDAAAKNDLGRLRNCCMRAAM